MSASDAGVTPEPGDPDTRTPSLRGFRVVIEVDDWDAALRFYRDALGLRARQGYANADSAQLILELPAATIELVHPLLPKVDGESDATNARGPRSPRVRLAIDSDDPLAMIATLVGAGAERVSDPLVVPSDSLSGRVIGPDGMPVTVFHALSEPDFSEPPPHAMG